MLEHKKKEDRKSKLREELGQMQIYLTNTFCPIMEAGQFAASNQTAMVNRLEKYLARIDVLFDELYKENLNEGE